ncbi:leucine-rich repeat protein [Youngiibacter multivorans]|uniref:leucine-rich repeat protein n=1 Tax=Youngiibacter multivorans TaxID=937251 RepID=UPI001FD83D67|nr:leucine-rich repeat protein [Youngiibacter multivorans]
MLILQDKPQLLLSIINSEYQSASAISVDVLIQPIPGLPTRSPYEFTHDGDFATIIRYFGQETDIIIPETVSDGIRSYKVISIGGEAFANNEELTSVVIPNGVIDIGVGSFAGCSNLKRVMFPESLESIGRSSFGGCTRLVSVTIPESVTRIGSSAFAKCERLIEAWFFCNRPIFGDGPELVAYWESAFGNINNDFRIYYLSGRTGWVSSRQVIPFYKVTYNASGGFGQVPVDENNYLEGDRVFVLDNTGQLSKPGYILAGWNTLDSGAGRDYEAGSYFAIGKESVTLYARWEPSAPVPEKYTLVFDINGGTGNTPAAVSVEYESEIRLPTQGDLSRTGYRFDGWNSMSDGSGRNYFAGVNNVIEPGEEALADGVAVLYARWVPIEYTMVKVPESATYNEPISMSATLMLGDKPIEGRRLIFKIADNIVGTAATDARGFAELRDVKVAYKAGTYPVSVYYLAGDVESAKGTSSLTVKSGSFPPGLIPVIIAIIGASSMLLIRKFGGKKKVPDDRPDGHSAHAPVIEHFTKVDFPAKCVLNRKVDLTIRLNKNAAEFKQSIKAIKEIVPGKTKSVTLNYKVTAPGFAEMVNSQLVQVGNKQMVLNLNGESEAIKFELYPQEVGDQRIEIELYFEGSRIDYSILASTVAETSQEVSAEFLGEKANAVSMDSPDNNFQKIQSITSEKKKTMEIRTLHVDYNTRKNKIVYHVYSKENKAPAICKVSLPNTIEEMFATIKEFTVFLDEIVKIGDTSAGEWKDIYFNLNSKCQNLYHMIVPDEITEMIKKWESSSAFIISTNEQWIPWEVFHDGSDFLSKKFIFSRYPRLPENKKIPQKDRAKSSSINIGQITNVVGGNFKVPQTNERVRKLFNFLPNIKVNPLIEESISDLVEVLPETDLLHITCHGSMTHPMLQISNEQTDYKNLNLDIIQNLPLKPGCFIFANACYSNTTVSVFKNLTSFGWEFYKDGAETYIGTLAQIPEVYAVEFAESLYQSLFSGEELTVGQVIHMVKNKMSSNKNIFWLLYSMYGDPITRFKSVK